MWSSRRKQSTNLEASIYSTDSQTFGHELIFGQLSDSVTQKLKSILVHHPHSVVNKLGHGG